MTSFFIRFFAIAAFCFTLTPARTFAAEAEGDPSAALIGTVNGVIDLVLGKSPAEIDSKLSEIESRMKENFAIDVIVRRSFGKNWSKLDAGQQKEAVDLVGKLMIRTYAVALSTGSRPTIKVVSSKKLDAQKWEVVTTATQDGKTVNVIYRLGKIDQAWRVYDILGEGISVVGNYRQQFDAHFEHKSAKELIDTLHAKLAAPATPPPATPAAK